MEVDNIRKFLAANYSDERLAALLGHTESGRLNYNCCCCLVGIPTATHALRTEDEFMNGGNYDPHHLISRTSLTLALEAEDEFKRLAPDDEGRRKLLLPLIHEEMGNRGAAVIARDPRNREDIEDRELALWVVESF